MKIDFNYLSSSSSVSSVAEKGNNIFGQLDRKIYLVAAILFAVLVTTALIYQNLKRGNEKTIRKGADLPSIQEEVDAINLTLTAPVFDQTSGPLAVTISDQTSGPLAVTISDQTSESLAVTVPEQASGSLKDQKETHGFPAYLETLKGRGLYKPAEFDSIIATVDLALRSPQGERIPPEYAKLQNLIKSEKQLELLYQEAKVLAHEYSVQDLESGGIVAGDREYKREYPKILFTNLSTLISGLCKHRQFEVIV